ncbi:alpha/beta fold hydrolase [Bdellovibrio sp. NC01]|uniref:alpha/beta fold hydrolase n=1 Tax=Bdellovibrio sp. NC01 TaxID=2220073 RepID=UPI00115A49B0|nr:alpha/beta hydrolase [Bdellovibrio sp. NC01]QDK36383.1 alpha/beta hydrolase [Bdellovibrio sp. NC01]
MKKMVLTLLVTLFAHSVYAIDVPKGFKQEKIQINGFKMNVYKGGTGTPVVLIHGMGETALWWEPAMKALSANYTVIVPDLRGGGLSEVTESGYTKVEMAADIKALLDHYDIAKADIVGHDIGLMVAYAFAAKYPAATSKLAVLDAFVPGVGPGDDIYNSPDIWHFRFHGASAENLVKGREKVYLNHLWTTFSADPKTFPESHKNYFTKLYAAPGHMKAAMAWFAAFPQDAKDNRELSKKQLPMPVLSIGGDKALGNELAATMKVVAPQSESVVLKNVGHWLMEEAPQPTIAALQKFLAGSDRISAR